MTVVPELLNMWDTQNHAGHSRHPLTSSRYATLYHPYCPIVPKYFLGRSSLESIQRPDYFLLTVLLTIASRDSPNYSLVHRYCWDYTQRLLLEVLLAQPWTQTQRTVEGLLLLSEWLPHIQISQTASRAPKSLFSEDRTAWSLIGLAVRHGYMLRLDRAAFRHRDSGNHEQMEQNRLIWTCKCSRNHIERKLTPDTKTFMLLTDKYLSVSGSLSGLAGQHIPRTSLQATSRASVPSPAPAATTTQQCWKRPQT